MMLIDRRQGSVELHGYLQDVSKVGTLEFGDVAFTGLAPDGVITIGVERKRLNDFIRSMRDGRLSGHQLPGMLQRYQRSYLLIEGIWRSGNSGLLETRCGGRWVPMNHGPHRFMASAIWNYAATIEEMLGVRVRMTTTIGETCHMLRFLHNWWQKPRHKAHQAFHEDGARVELRRPSFLRRVAKEIPGIGWDRSAAVAQHFGSLENMMEATIEDWMSIEGFGKVLANQAYRELHGNGK